jgi:flagellar motor component MotA
MDLASLIGFIGAIGAILATMIMGGGVAPFIDTQSIFIVFGGTFFLCDVSEPSSGFPGKFRCNVQSIYAPCQKDG